MTEIYWLQRLGKVAYWLNAGCVACVVVAVVIAVICFFIALDDGIDSKELTRFKGWFKKYAFVFAFFLVGAFIVPTEEELIAIYGLGGTIDYIKSNDKAKQLPDKVVDALTKYVDTIVNDKEKENK